MKRVTPILVVLILVITLGVTISSINTPQTLKSDAQTISTLTPPYIRLDSFQKTYTVGNQVPVQIFANTGNQRTLQNRLGNQAKSDH